MGAWVCPSCGGQNPAGTRFCGHCGTPAEDSGPRPEGDVTQALRSFVATQVADRLVEAGGTLTEERRLVTALFADVSGFTSLAEVLDPEALTEVIDPVVSRLSTVVGRYEGYVEKFAGDALLALFGAPRSHEDDATRALMTALEMHEELREMLPELPKEARHLTLHVGVNTGHGVARVLGSEVRLDYGVLGDSVILAQRLESAAPAGETYVGEITHRLAESGFEFESVGELTLKGKAQPVPAWRLVGPSVAAETSPGPTASIVGRDDELKLVDAALAELAERRPALVAVVGEPGVGKSRLTTEVRKRVEAAGFAWVEARCLSYGAGIAYWPYIDLVRRATGIGANDALEVAAERLAQGLKTYGVDDAYPYLGSLLGLPDAGAGVADLEPEALRRGLHAAFSSWLTAMAEVTPVVVAFEDWHWSDASSRELTDELRAAASDTAMGLYVTARPEATESVSSLAQTGGHLLRLEPLGPDFTEALIGLLLGGSASEELKRLVVDRTAGNPFFVEETVRALRDSGLLTETSGRWELSGRGDASIPPTIEGVISARIDLLPRSAADTLLTASVIGRTVRVPLLNAVLNGGGPVEAALDELVDRGFLDRPQTTELTDSLVFHHALVQEVAYARLLRRQKRRLHERVAAEAEILYGAGDDVIDLLARHLFLADAGARAVHYLVRAGRRSARLFANGEAILHFERAAEVARAHPEASDLLGSILLHLGRLHELVGNYPDALRMYDEARAETQDVAAWRGMASSLRSQGHYEDALEVVEEGFGAVADDEARAHLWLERAWTLAVEGQPAMTIEAALSGLEVSGEGDPVAGYLLAQLAQAEIMSGAREDALEHAVRATAIFEGHEDLPGLATALRTAGYAYERMGRLDDAAATLRRGIEIAERIGNAEETAGCLINLGLVEMDRGAHAEALNCDLRAIEVFERIGHGSGRANATANLAEKYMKLGDLDKGLELCHRAIEMADEIGHQPSKANALETMASIQLLRGDYPLAGATAEEAARLNQSMGAVPFAKASWEIAADAWAKAGDDERSSAALARAKKLD